jgi:serine/threonine-protein kinase RsbW
VVITFSLCLPRDEASVPVIRGLCKSALDDLGVEDSCVSDIELAVTEACTNVLKHADGTSDIYETTVEISDTDCTIRVIDSGEGFDASLHGQGAGVEGAESGRGILLIRALVDNVRFISRPEDGTIVHLEKNLVLKPTSILKRLSAAPA